METTSTFTAFCATRRIVTSALEETLTACRRFLDESPGSSLLIFEDLTGSQVDFDMRGSLEEVLARALPQTAKKGPGRPRLGVVCNEICLLPRHWEWLDQQPRKASATIRRLVDHARKNVSADEEAEHVIAAVGRFMSAMAGNLIGYEEASRALYAKRWRLFDRLVAPWPADIVAHMERLLNRVRQHDEIERAGYVTVEISGGPLAASAATSGEGPWRLPALDLAMAISRGKYSASEAVGSYLERIERLNPSLTAITRVLAEEARSAAQEIDMHLETGQSVGPLAGIPFTVKDNIDICGVPTTHGIPALKDAVPTMDAPIVSRLRAAGAIVIGHTNLPDLSLRFHTSSTLFGHTRNPWDPRFSPAGSSGGEAAAVAAGLSALGVGNDAGGSLRLPAQFCGIAALKPTAGRLPSDRQIGQRNLTLASQLIPTDGFLARSVRDLHIAFQITAGPHPADPRVAPVPPLLTQGVGSARVAVSANPGGMGVHPAVGRAVDEAAEALAKAGYDVVSAEPPLINEILEAYGRLIMTEFSEVAEMLARLLGADGRKYLEYSMARAKPADLAGYLRTIAERQGMQREWASFMEEYPLILGPVFTEDLVPPDFDIRGEDEFRQVALAMRLCSVTSFIGVPAIAVPTSIDGRKPRGVQVIGAPYREDVCFEAAAVLERHFGRFTPVTPLLSPA